MYLGCVLCSRFAWERSPFQRLKCNLAPGSAGYTGIPAGFHPIGPVCTGALPCSLAAKLTLCLVGLGPRFNLLPARKRYHR